MQGTAFQDEVDLMKGYLAYGWLLPAAIITPYVIYKQVTGYHTTLEKCVEALVVFDRSIIFLSDPGKPGVRSLGPDVTNKLRHLVQT